MLSSVGVAAMVVTDHDHPFQPGAGNYRFGFEGWEFVRGQQDDHWATERMETPRPAERAQSPPPPATCRHISPKRGPGSR